MPRWDVNNVCHPKFINKTLQQITDHEDNNKYNEKPKIQEKSARRKCRGHLNHKLSIENNIYDPLTVFSKPEHAMIIKIMR